ncbi:MAG: CAAX amino terminal protease self- immunity [Methanosaeta sp. PtaB.Bin039]|nr:MAG: CAAX amino terminal protease self- immunity [Methanosaeta sp. PtaB.Bin039]
MNNDKALVWIKLAVLLLLFGFAGAIGMGALAPWIFGIDLSSPESLSSASKLAMLTTGTAFTTAIIFLFRKFADKKPVTSMGLVDNRWFKMSLVGLGLGGLVQIIVFLSLSLIGNYKMNSLSSLPAIIYFAAAAVVAWQEETLYRAYIIENLKIYGDRFALIASAVIFVIPHFSGRGFSNPAEYISIFLFGMVVGMAYLRSHSIFLPLGFHTGFNFFEDILLKTPAEISGAGFESLSWVALGAVTLLLLTFLERYRSKF